MNKKCFHFVIFYFFIYFLITFFTFYFLRTLFLKSNFKGTTSIFLHIINCYTRH